RLREDAFADAPYVLPRPDLVGGLSRRGGGDFLGGLVIQLDHDAVGVVDKDLPEIAAGNLARLEPHALGLQALFHAVKAPAHERDMMDAPGIGLLRLLRPRDVDKVDHRLALA